MKIIILLSFISIFPILSQAQTCSKFLSAVLLSADKTQSSSVVIAQRFPNGFWQNQNNLDRLVKIILSQRPSAFLHDLKDDDFLDLQDKLVEAFSVKGLNGKKLSTNIRTLYLTEQWAKALEKSGHPKNLEEGKILQFKTVLKLRRKAKLDISLKGLLADHSKASQQIYKKVFNEVISPEAFHLRVSKKYKSWELFLTDSGYPAEQFVERTNLLSDHEIPSVLNAIVNKRPEYDLSRENIKVETSKEMSDFIFTIIGRRVTLKSIYRAAIEIKTWSEWIEESGVDYKTVKKGSFQLTDQEIIKVIKHLYGSNYPVHLSQVEKDDSLIGTNLVFEAIGRKLTVKNIYNASKVSGSWANWIKMSGFDYRKIRLTRFYLTDEEIIKATRALFEMKFLMNAVSLRYNIEPDAMALIKKTIGFSLYPRTIYRIAAEKRPWFLWLSMAGLDVTQIQLSGKIPYKLVNEITKASLRQTDSNREAMLGNSSAFQALSEDQWERIQVDENDGESVLIQKEFNDAFEDFNDELNDDEQKFLQYLIDSIEQGLDLTQAIEMQAFIYGPETKMLFQSLFAKIKNNPKFIEMLTTGGD